MLPEIQANVTVSYTTLGFLGGQYIFIPYRLHANVLSYACTPAMPYNSACSGPC